MLARGKERMLEATFVDYGDSGILINFSDKFSEKSWKKTHFLANEIRKRDFKEILSIVPTLTSIFIHFDLLRIERREIIQNIKEIMDEINEKNMILNSGHYKIPMVFGGDYGPDLEKISTEMNTSQEELVKLITSKPHRILAFSRGPMMQSPASDKIERLKSPRTSVPSGTLGIAFNQISISSMEAPSGWKMLGQSPVILLDSTYDPPGVLSPGDYITFFSIKEKEFDFYQSQHVKEMDEKYE